MAQGGGLGSCLPSQAAGSFVLFHRVPGNAGNEAAHSLAQLQAAAAAVGAERGIKGGDATLSRQLVISEPFLSKNLLLQRVCVIPQKERQFQLILEKLRKEGLTFLDFVCVCADET